MSLDSKTREMLISWEARHGLDVIQQRLDDGLFAHDKKKQRLCYAWLKGRRAAPVIRIIWHAILGISTVIAAGTGLVSVLKR